MLFFDDHFIPILQLNLLASTQLSNQSVKNSSSPLHFSSITADTRGKVPAALMVKMAKELRKTPERTGRSAYLMLAVSSETFQLKLASEASLQHIPEQRSRSRLANDGKPVSTSSRASGCEWDMPPCEDTACGRTKRKQPIYLFEKCLCAAAVVDKEGQKNSKQGEELWAGTPC